jgi:hypothetical protein
MRFTHKRDDRNTGGRSNRLFTNIGNNPFSVCRRNCIDDLGRAQPTSKPVISGNFELLVLEIWSDPLLITGNEILGELGSSL